MKQYLLLMTLLAKPLDFHEEIPIGKMRGFTYTIKMSSAFEHDDNMHAKYFVVFKQGTKRMMCSSISSKKRNDTTFVRGRYIKENDKLFFIENYFFIKNKVSSDSMIKVFSPNPKGQLLLREITMFRKGAKTVIKY